MQLDVRLPMGLLFLVLGVILTVYGLATAEDSAMYARALGDNVNLHWGVVFVVFGGVVLGLAWRGRKKGGEDKN